MQEPHDAPALVPQQSVSTDPARYFDFVPVPTCPCCSDTPDAPTLLHLTLTDGIGYETHWVKAGNETLHGLLAAYSWYSGIELRYLNLEFGVTTLDHFAKISDLPIYHHCRIRVTVNLARLLLLNLHIEEQALTALPTDKPPNGPTVKLAIHTRNIWAGAPDMIVRCTVPASTTPEFIRQTIAKYHLTAQRRTLVLEGTRDVNAPFCEPGAPTDTATLLISGKEPEDPWDDVLHGIVQNEHLTHKTTAPRHEAILFIVELSQPGRLVGHSGPKRACILRATDSYEDLVRWADEAFPPFLRNHLNGSNSSNPGSLLDEGFTAGSVYHLSLLPHILPIPKRAHRTISTRVRLRSGILRYLPMRECQTAANIIKILEGDGARRYRLLMDGERLEDDKPLRQIRDIENTVLDLEEQQVGGGTSPDPLIHLTLKDLLGYKARWSLTASGRIDEMLIAYAFHAGLDPGRLVLFLGSRPLDHTKSIADLPVKDGDTLDVRMDMEYLSDIARQIGKATAHLPPVPDKSRPHLKEVPLRLHITLNGTGPFIPCLKLNCPVSNLVTMGSVLEELSILLFFKNQHLEFDVGYTGSEARVEDLANGADHLDLTISRRPSLDPRDEILRHTVNFIRIPNKDNLPRCEAVAFVIERVNKSRVPFDRAERKAYVARDSDDMEMVREWARQNFALPDADIYSGNRALRHGTLKCNGFRPGGVYYLFISPPWFMTAMEYSGSGSVATRGYKTLNIHTEQYGDPDIHLTIRDHVTVKELIQSIVPTEAHKFRLLHDGTRLLDQHQLSDIPDPVINLDIVLERIGGAPHHGTPLTTYPPLGDSSDSEDDPAGLGDVHGLLKGLRVYDVPAPRARRRDFLRLELIGREVGQWLGLIHNDTALWTIFHPLEVIYDQKLAFYLGDQNLDRASTSRELDLQDAASITVRPAFAVDQSLGMPCYYLDEEEVTKQLAISTPFSFSIPQSAYLLAECSYEKIQRPAGHVRLQLFRKYEPRLTAVLGAASPLKALHRYLASLAGEPLTFKVGRITLDTTKSAFDLGLDDAAAIDVTPVNPPTISRSSILAFDSDQPVLGPEFGQIYSNSWAAITPDECKKIHLRLPKGPSAVLVAGPKYPLSNLREYVDDRFGANHRIEYLGERLDTSLLFEQAGFEEEDDIDIRPEQIGGGDRSMLPATEPDLSESEEDDFDNDDEDAYSETTATGLAHHHTEPVAAAAPAAPTVNAIGLHSTSFAPGSRQPSNSPSPEIARAVSPPQQQNSVSSSPTSKVPSPSGPLQALPQMLVSDVPALTTAPSLAPATTAPAPAVPPVSQTYHPAYGFIPHGQHLPGAQTFPHHSYHAQTPMMYSAPLPQQVHSHSSSPPKTTAPASAPPGPYMFPGQPPTTDPRYAPQQPMYYMPAFAPPGFHQIPAGYMPAQAVSVAPRTQRPPPTIPGLKPYSLLDENGNQPRRQIKSLMRAGANRFIPKFKGTNALSWIESYEALGRKEKAEPIDLVEHLQFNVSAEKPDIWSRVSKHTAFAARDWEALKRYLVTGFEGPLWQKYHLHDLESFVDTPRIVETVEDLNTYINQFQEIGEPLKLYKKITHETLVEHFIRGLPDWIRDELQRDDTTEETPAFEQVAEQVRGYVAPSTYFRRLNQDIQRRIGRIEKKTPTLVPQFTLNTDSQPKDTTEALTAGLDKLALTMTQAIKQGTTRPPSYRNTTAASSPPPPAPTTPAPVIHQAQQGPPPSMGSGANALPLGQRSDAKLTPQTAPCVYCGEIGHWKKECTVMSEHLAKGWTLDIDNRVCYPNGQVVRAKPGTYGALIQSLVDSGTLPPAPEPATGSNSLHLVTNLEGPFREGLLVNTIRPASEALPDRAPKRRATNNSRAAEARATEAIPPPVGLTPAIPEIHRPLQTLPRVDTRPAPVSTPPAEQPRRVTFEQPLAAPSPESQPAVATQPNAPSQPAVSSQPPAESVMEEDDEIEEIPVKTPPLQRRLRASRLQRLANPEEAAKTLLDQEVALTWRQIVGLSPAVQKVILEHIRNELVPLPTTGVPMPWLTANTQALCSTLNWVNQITRDTEELGAVERVGKYFVDQLTRSDAGDDDVNVWYTRALPVADAEIRGYRCAALFDSGSQVNTIRASLHRELMLPIRTDGSHTIVGAGKKAIPLLGVAENIPVTVGGVTIRAHFWVMQESGPELLLGMPALRQLHAEIDCRNGFVIIKDKDGRIIEIPVIQDKDPANTSDMLTAAHLTQTHTMHNASDEAMPLSINYIAKIDPTPDLLSHKPLPFHFNAKAKRVADKIKPTAAPGSDWHEQHFNPPNYDRDPYDTPLRVPPPEFVPTPKLTEDRVSKLNFGPPGFINEQERTLLLHVLTLRAKALAFEDSDRGFLNPDYGAEQKLFMKDHEPWVASSRPYPKAQYQKIVDLLRSYLKANILEYSTSPYVIPHFCVAKSNGDPRLIFDFSPGNKYLVPDRGIMPFALDVIDCLVGCVCYFYLDIMSFFHQLLAHESSRKYSAIRTPLGLLQLRTVVPGGANSPAHAQRVINHIAGSDLLDAAIAFCDDVVGKGPRSRYNEAVLPGTEIRRWLFEFAVTLERILYRLEHANLVVSAAKMVVITPEVEIVGVRVSEFGKRLDPSKVDRLQVWPDPCPSQASLRGFLGLANYLRAHIPNFAQLDAPLRALVGKKWSWTPEASIAMQQIKDAARTTEYLTVIDYTSDDPIVLSVDSSDIATGFVLAQDRPSGRAIALYDSVAFTDVEQRYSQPKLELCGVYKAVRKLRYHLTGISFILEVDASALIQMINKPDVTTGPMARWIANLKLFDFTIRHIPGKAHIIPDGLSRTDFSNPEAAEEYPDEETTMRAYNIEADIADTPQETTVTPDPIPFDESLYEDEFIHIGRWLSTGGLHPELKTLSRATRRWTRRQMGRYILLQGRLFKTNGEEPPLLVLGLPKDRDTALRLAHDDCGHRGRDATLNHLLRRVWWPALRKDVNRWIGSCHVCQVRSLQASTEPLRFAPITRLFEQFALDIVDTGVHTGPRRYLIVARCLLTSWVEARALPNKLASSVAKFIEDEILSRYGPVVRQILTDNGSENASETDALLRKVGLRHARITPHHPQGNAVVERGHAALVWGLLKAAYDDRARTHTYLPQVLWSDRITARRTTGKSPFELVYGYEPLLPIDHELDTFAMVEWSLCTTRPDLIACRARQLRRRDDDLAFATLRLRQARNEGRAYQDDKMADKLRAPLPPETVVLVRATSTFLGKAEDRWMGPYRVVSQQSSGAYTLKEFDGTVLSSTFGPDRLRRYFIRPRTPLEIRDFLDPAVDDASFFPLGTPASIMDSLSQVPAHGALPPPAAPLTIDDDLSTSQQAPISSPDAPAIEHTSPTTPIQDTSATTAPTPPPAAPPTIDPVGSPDPAAPPPADDPGPSP